MGDFYVVDVTSDGYRALVRVTTTDGARNTVEAVSPGDDDVACAYETVTDVLSEWPQDVEPLTLSQLTRFLNAEYMSAADYLAAGETRDSTHGEAVESMYSEDLRARARRRVAARPDQTEGESTTPA